MAASSSPGTGIESVDISSNSFVNGWDEPTYQYGLFIGPGVRFLSVGQNWYHNIKQADIELAVLGPGTVVRLPGPHERHPAELGSAPVFTIDAGRAGRFSLDVTSAVPFTIASPQISTGGASAADGTEIEITIHNRSGAVTGDVTWPAGYKASWSNATDKPPGTGSGCNITLRFSYDAASKTWREIFKSSPEIPN